MKKFIKGMFKLDEDVVELEAYEELHSVALREIIDYAENHHMDARFGTAEDDTYLMEFVIRGETQQYCKGILSGLRALLKKEWKGKVDILYQASGELIDA